VQGGDPDIVRESQRRRFHVDTFDDIEVPPLTASAVRTN
jgi:hypothetical protein